MQNLTVCKKELCAEWLSKKYNKDGPLFVTRKYDNLKEEILNYKHINIKHYKQEILPKANAYYKTKLVQSMKPGE